MKLIGWKIEQELRTTFQNDVSNPFQFQRSTISPKLVHDILLRLTEERGKDVREMTMVYELEVTNKL